MDSVVSYALLGARVVLRAAWCGCVRWAQPVGGDFEVLPEVVAVAWLVVSPEVVTAAWWAAPFWMAPCWMW